jgi:hypothetical protein
MLISYRRRRGPTLPCPLRVTKNRDSSFPLSLPSRSQASYATAVIFVCDCGDRGYQLVGRCKAGLGRAVHLR